jgi:membrane-bound lytic murein transglycosylase A
VRPALAALSRLGLGAPEIPTSTRSARAFIEERFTPVRVTAQEGEHGLFTGYYEPQLAAARWRSDVYPVPIHEVPERLPMPGPARADIEDGRAGREWPVCFWAADAVDVFLMHVQGSARLRLADGAFTRVAFAGHNGRSYVAIGRLLRERGILPASHIHMPAICEWLREHPRDGRGIMQENPRYIFFREIPDSSGPVGQTGLPLIPMLSMAVDADYVPLGTPIWLETNWPADPTRPLRLLTIALDTGAAIKGPVRGDLFWGTGAEAFELAGRMAERGRYFVLLPRGDAASLDRDVTAGRVVG